MEITETYSNKIDSCVKAISLLGCNVKDIVNKYKDDFFPDEGPNKSVCFTEIIKKNLSEEIYNYLESACNLPHHRDSRNAYEYGIDLVLGWLIEDAVLTALEEKGKKAILSGHDRYREFLSPRKISTQPDIIVEFLSGEKMVDVFADWRGTWRDQNHADLRDNKYNKLKKEEAILLGIAPLTSEGFLIDLAEDEERFQENFIPAYQKMGYTYKGIRAILRPLDEVMRDLMER